MIMQKTNVSVLFTRTIRLLTVFDLLMGDIINHSNRKK